ncbi:MAG: rhodanese-like domain-containing protein, partial [Thermodesulfobacteriota bacterium]
MKNLNSTIRLWIFVSLLLVPVLALAAHPIEDISARTAADLIQENLSNPDFIILDIRTPGEFDAGHIAGAHNIDFYAKTFAQEFRSLDHEKTYLIYCRSGNRSRQLMGAVEKMRFKRIFHMRSGLVDWV